jgi:hypothetical protein
MLQFRSNQQKNRNKLYKFVGAEMNQFISQIKKEKTMMPTKTIM